MTQDLQAHRFEDWLKQVYSTDPFSISAFYSAFSDINASFSSLKRPQVKLFKDYFDLLIYSFEIIPCP